MLMKLIENIFLTPKGNKMSEVKYLKWWYGNTLISLELYKKYKKQMGTLRIKTLKRTFEKIAKDLEEQFQMKVTSSNCENHSKHLERSYKKTLLNNNSIGRERKDFECQEEMYEILGRKKNIHPVLLLETYTIDAETRKRYRSKILRAEILKEIPT